MLVSLSPPSGAGARSVLRDATAEDHRRVDALYGACDLACDRHYRRFLVAHAAAFLPVEDALERDGIAAWLPDWHARRRGDALRADLAGLDERAPDAFAAPRYAGQAAALGAAYVLEGSRMGGARLRRALPHEAPQRFLGAPQPASSWRRLVETLEAALDTPAALAAAIASAREVFQLFEASGQHYLESVTR
jgi:heme oxygenase